MLITSKLEMDLRQPVFKQVAYAVQSDSNTRALEISLFLGSTPWEIPPGTTAAVSFRKMDLTSGLYDTLPDGSTKAVTFSGNTLTAILAPQVLTCAGKVDISIALYDSGLNRLGVFPILLYVSTDPSAGKDISNNYYYLSTLAAVNEAIGNLNDLKTVTKESLVSAINEIISLGGGDLTQEVQVAVDKYLNENPPDWSAKEGEAGHIKDRTHWVENVALAQLPVVGKWVDDNNDGANDTFYFSAPVGLEVGKTYTVNWNGTNYEVVCRDISTIEGATISGLFLGNPAVAGFVEASTDEPFLMVELSSEDATQMGAFGMVAGLDKAEVPFAIYNDREVVHKLDNKFLDLDWLSKVKGNALIKEQTVHCVQMGNLIMGELTVDKAFKFLVDLKVPVVVVINGEIYKAFGTADYDADMIYVEDKVGFLGYGKTWYFVTHTPGTYTVAVYENNENIIPDAFLPERLQSENVVPRSGGNFMGTVATRDVYVGGAKDAYGNWSPKGARIVDHTPLDVSTKNAMYISTMQIQKAGEYFLILPEGSNYLYEMQILEADLFRSFDVNQMPEIPAGTYPDYYPYQVGRDIYVNFSAKTGVDLSDKLFSDGHQFQKRLNFRSKTYYVDDDTDRPYPAVQFTVSGPAVVHIWWVAGGDGRYFAIQSKEGSGASRLEVSGTLNVHGRQYMNGNTLDMGGGDIVDVQSITTHGSAYIGNEATVRGSLEVGSELQVGGRLTMTNGSTFDANGGDVKGVKSLRMNGTLEVDNDSKLRSIKPVKKWDDTGTEQEVYNIGTDESYYDKGCFNRIRVGKPVRDSTGKIVGHEYSEVDKEKLDTVLSSVISEDYSSGTADIVPDKNSGWFYKDAVIAMFCPDIPESIAFAKQCASEWHYDGTEETFGELNATVTKGDNYIVFPRHNGYPGIIAVFEDNTYVPMWYGSGTRLVVEKGLYSYYDIEDGSCIAIRYSYGPITVLDKVNEVDEKLEATLGSYITDVAALVGGDA